MSGSIMREVLFAEKLSDDAKEMKTSQAISGK